MREAFYEESAVSASAHTGEKLYTVFRVISIIFYVFAGIHAFNMLMTIPGVLAKVQGVQLVIVLIEWIGLLLVLVGLGLLFGWIKLKYNVSFDYIFVEDELRISKVFNGRKRKLIVRMRADSIMKIGLCDRDSYERTLAGNGSPVFLTPNKSAMEGKMFIYILYSTSLAKTVYVLECREALLEYLVSAVGRNKLELQ